jgi:hypothetical protein
MSPSQTYHPGISTFTTSCRSLKGSHWVFPSIIISSETIPSLAPGVPPKLNEQEDLAMEMILPFREEVMKSFLERRAPDVRF